LINFFNFSKNRRLKFKTKKISKNKKILTNGHHHPHISCPAKKKNFFFGGEILKEKKNI
jgi:hypothetical protein